MASATKIAAKAMVAIIDCLDLGVAVSGLVGMESAEMHDRRKPT